jgi:methylphosphotriester-DNA--protein-cysteine methyltransferase
LPRKAHRRCSDTKATTLKQADKVCNIMEANTGRSMRSSIKQLGTGKNTVRRITQEDLCYNSMFMSKVSKARRAERTRKLLARLKHPTVANQLLLSSDEKNFTLDQKVNLENNQGLCSDPTKVLTP